MFVGFQLTHFHFLWIFLSFSGVPIFLLYWFVLWLDVIIVLGCIGFSYDVRTELNPIKTDKDHLSTVTGSYVIDQIILQFAAVAAICTFEILKKGKSFHHKLLTLSFEWGPLLSLPHHSLGAKCQPRHQPIYWMSDRRRQVWYCC